MKTSRMRIMAISGATLALVVAGTSVATANHDDGDQRDPGRGRAGASSQRDGGFADGLRQHVRREVREHFGGGQRGDQRGFGQRGDRRGFGEGLRREAREHFGGKIDSFVRRETTTDLGEDGIVTRRVDNGTATGAGDSSLDYTLATGDSVSVTIDDDTTVIAFDEPDESAQNEGRRRFRGPRLIPTEISVADIEAGSEIVVWAESRDGGPFLAQRIVAQPVFDESVDEDGSADEADEAEDEATEADTAAEVATDA